MGVNTHLTNKIVLNALKNNLIDRFKNMKILNEVKFGDNTEFDFLISKKIKSFIEVKNVTLSRVKGSQSFGTITSRGLKHISELIKTINWFEIYLLYVIQRNDYKKLKFAKDIDYKYYELLVKLLKNLNILCYDCKFSSKE